MLSVFPTFAGMGRTVVLTERKDAATQPPQAGRASMNLPGMYFIMVFHFLIPKNGVP